MKKVIIAILMCAMLPIAGHAGKIKRNGVVKPVKLINTLTGKVISGGLGVPFATVAYVSAGQSRTKLTDESGNFKLFDVNAASGLTVSKAGYATKQVSLSSPNGGVVVTLSSL